MKLVLGTNTLGLGGSETYLLTVAEHLDRLGHRVIIYAPTVGEMGTLARARALRVTEGGELPDDCDAVLVQDAAVAFDLARRYPAAPRVFVAHGTTFDLASASPLTGMTSTAVALNERTASRLAALNTDIEVVRLTQPIDVQRFPAGPYLPEKAARVLVLSNRLDQHRRLLEKACSDAGLELLEVGALAVTTLDPASALSEADIVVGYGRSILEAMACGRAAYVYDHRGGDGWVTAESYPAIERNGFAGGVPPTPGRPGFRQSAGQDSRSTGGEEVHARASNPATRDVGDRACSPTTGLVGGTGRSGGPPRRRRDSPGLDEPGTASGSGPVVATQGHSRLRARG